MGRSGLQSSARPYRSPDNTRTHTTHTRRVSPSFISAPQLLIPSSLSPAPAETAFEVKVATVVSAWQAKYQSAITVSGLDVEATAILDLFVRELCLRSAKQPPTAHHARTRCARASATRRRLRHPPLRRFAHSATTALRSDPGLF